MKQCIPKVEYAVKTYVFNSLVEELGKTFDPWTFPHNQQKQRIKDYVIVNHVTCVYYTMQQ